MQPYLIALGFILIDIVTGFCKAFYNGSFNSTVMRQGGFHKLSEIFAMIFAYFLEYACSWVDLGVDVPIANAIIIYLCIMEIISILENLCEMNPGLKKLFEPYLTKLQNKE